MSSSELIKSDGALELLRVAGRILADTHAELAKHIAPGIAGAKLDGIAEAFIRDHGAEPAFKGFDDFPATICFSRNAGMVHGIPTDEEIAEGDVIKLDVGVRFKGWNTDAARTHLVPPSEPKNQLLVDVTQAALDAGIAQVRAGVPLGTVQAAIQAVIEDAELGLVRQLTGHGIGQSVHEAPSIPNFGRAGQGMPLQSGMVICLEPMVTRGSGHVREAADGWTYESTDGSMTAHIEDTIIVTETQGEIITRSGATTVDTPRTF